MLLLAGFLWLAVTLVYLGRTDLLLAPIKSALQLLQNVEEDGEEVAEVVSSEDGTLAAEA